MYYNTKVYYSHLEVHAVYYKVQAVRRTNKKYKQCTIINKVQAVPGNLVPTGDNGLQVVRGDVEPKGFPEPTERDGRNDIPGEQSDKGPQRFPGGEGCQGLDVADKPPGFDGTPDLKEFSGQQGDTGFWRSDGPPGFDGRQGDTGFSESVGPPGFDVLQGDTGLFGIPGSQGYTGLQGRNGFQGDAGEQGFPGPDATTGETGRPGVPVIRKSDGEDGRPVHTGETGDTGEKECPGPQGPAGSKDSASTLELSAVMMHLVFQVVEDLGEMSVILPSWIHWFR